MFSVIFWLVSLYFCVQAFLAVEKSVKTIYYVTSGAFIIGSLFLGGN